MAELPLPEESIFAQALEVPSAKRAAFLDQVCGANRDLRAEVEALLRADAQSGDLLDLPDASTPTMDASGAAVGTVIAGRYKLLEMIGEGGMGTVWMAQQTEPVKRLVAVKLIKPGMDSRQVLARFEAERQALALMDHPNIAKVFDGGMIAGVRRQGPGVRGQGSGVRGQESGDRRQEFELTPVSCRLTPGEGRPYFAMELVKGVPITEYCDKKHLTPRQRLELFVPVCQAVQHAHQKGIIHRDLKPSNVLVTMHDTAPVVKVIDFGVAKALGHELTEKTLFTGFAQLVGTPLYMSPEQAGQSGLDVDTRSDVYSLGVLLYELLTGTTPFDKERLRAAGYDEIRRIIREEEPARPSTRLSTLGQAAETVSANRGSEPRKLTALVRGELDWVVMKALEKDRSRRYESASALASDVQRYLADEPVEACPPSAAYRLRKFVQRNRGAVLAATVFALIVIGGAIGTSVGLVQAEQARKAAAREQDKAERERDQKEVARRHAVANLRKAREAIDRMLTRVAEVHLLAVPQTELLRRQLLQDALSLFEDLAETGGDDPELRAETALAYARLGSICRLLGADTEAEHRLRRALVLLDEFAADPGCDARLRVARVESHRQLGWLLITRGRREEAETVQRRALELAEQLAADSPDNRDYRNDLAHCCINLGVTVGRSRPAEAAGLYRRAIQLTDCEAGNRYYLGLAHQSQGYLLRETQPREAEVALRKAVAIFEPLAQDRQPSRTARQSLATTLAYLGAVLTAAGEHSEAVQSYRSAANIAEKIAADAPRVPLHTSQLALCRLGLAGALRSMRQFREAETECQNVLRLLQQVTTDYPDTLDWRAVWLVGELDPSRFLVLGQELHPATERRSDPPVTLRTDGEMSNLTHHAQQADAYLEIARLHAAEGQPVKSESAYQAAFDVFRDLHSRFSDKPEHEENLAVVLARGGLTLKNAGRYDDAARICRWSVDVSTKVVAKDTENRQNRERLAGEYFRLGGISSHLRRQEEAEKAYRQAAAHYDRLAQSGPRHHDFLFAHASTRNNLGRELACLGRSQEAVRQFRRSLDLYSQLPADFRERPGYKRNDGLTRNNLAWVLATTADLKARNANEAVELAKQAVDLVPDAGTVWNTLCVAHYRNGDFKAAAAALAKSMELRSGGDSFDWFFLAMVQWQTKDRDGARKWFDKAVAWMEANQPKNEELGRFRREAEELFGMTVKRD